MRELPPALALQETGIGENRVIVFEGGEPVEYRIERPGLRVGDRAAARLVRREGTRAFVTLADTEALIDPAPPGVAEGAMLMIEVRREAIPEPGRPRLARAIALPPETAPHPGPTLLARLPALIEQTVPHGPDRLEQAGWSEAVEEARTGRLTFPGGQLALTRTPAFLAVDVDGPGAPFDLARAAAVALARAIRRFDLGGSIVVDFPSLADRAQRTAVGDLLDAHLPAPFERTAMNGFGLVQIVRPKLRPSFLDQVQGDAPATAALARLRLAERDAGTGELTLDTSAAIAAWLAARPRLLAELARRIGRAVRLAPAAPLPTC